MISPPAHDPKTSSESNPTILIMPTAEKKEIFEKSSTSLKYVNKKI